MSSKFKPRKEIQNNFMVALKEPKVFISLNGECLKKKKSIHVFKETFLKCLLCAAPYAQIIVCCDTYGILHYGLLYWAHST